MTVCFLHFLYIYLKLYLANAEYEKRVIEMKRRKLFLAIFFLGAFLLWTVMVSTVDVQAVGPCSSRVGFATLNTFFHSLTGVNLTLYLITDWLGLVPIGVALGFAILGLVQWIKRKRLVLVDFTILLLGGFYIAVAALYIFFEFLALNYRPVLISGYLEASYPSSTTLLVACVMPTSTMQINSRIKSIALRRCVGFAVFAFVAFMVIGRIISGVHWITDIVGSALLSGGMLELYSWLAYKNG